MKAVFIAGALLFCGCSHTVPWVSDSKAIELAHASVLDHLKAPASAKFSGDTVCLLESDMKVLRVFGSVDAQNEFGALIRQHYNVTFKYDNGPAIRSGDCADVSWGPLNDSLNAIYRARRDSLNKSMMIEIGKNDREIDSLMEFMNVY